MKLKHGKYYYTRDGRRAFVSQILLPNPFKHKENNTHEVYPFAFGYIEGSELPNALIEWKMDGRRWSTHTTPLDLVEEA